MEKNTFCVPEMELILFECDVITTSGGQSGNTGSSGGVVLPDDIW